MKTILAGKDVVFNLPEFEAVDIQVPASAFKDIDKNVTVVTAAGSGTVKTKSLWNNSGKDRLIRVRGGRLEISNK
jgi:putative intracellular protease/amidase